MTRCTILLGIAALGLELYGAWRICALHLITIPQISGILFGTSVGQVDFWTSPWLSLPAIGLSLILFSVILNHAASFFLPKSKFVNTRDQLKDAVWSAIAPVRSIALSSVRDAVWHKGDGRYGENLGGLKLYRRGLFRRHMEACLVIRFARAYPDQVQFAIDFWRRGWQTKNLWIGEMASPTTALAGVVQQLEQRVHQLAQTWRAGDGITYPVDWSGQPFASWFPESLDQIRDAFIAGAAICGTVFVLGFLQLFYFAGYNWAHWGPFGGLTISSAFAGCAFGTVWSTRDAASDRKRVLRRMYSAATCAVIATCVALPSLYFIIKSMLLLAPQCMRPGG